MSFKKTLHTSAKVAFLNAACLVGAMAAPAFAQEANQSSAETEDVIVVTGFRGALTSSTNAKRNATGFQDSVFAEDIGQFPDTNIAESLNRIPGVTIAREVNGEGLNIAIRGLDTNFTKIVLNGNSIGVASSGSADSQNVNRELDLDIFPTELFTRLDVSKSPQAHMMEGGVAGIVNMRSARPFDYQHSQITYSVQGNYTSQNEEWSPRGALIASGRWQTSIGEFGALFGYAGVRNQSSTDGFETIGWTNPNLTYNQCGVAPTGSNTGTSAASECNSGANGYAAGGNGFRWADFVPTVAPPGTTAGQTVDAAMLQSLNPGLTLQQLGSAFLPRLGRPSHFDGDRNRDAVLASFQFSPGPGTELYLDIMAAQADRKFNREDLMFEVRNSGGNPATSYAFLPYHMTVDSNNVVTGGDFYNARLFLEARPYHEELEFLNVNPGGSFQIADALRLDVQMNYSHSVFFREQPTIGLTLPGLVLHYSNNGGDFPTWTTNVNPNDPNAGWQWLRVNLQNEKRTTITQGFHSDLTWGDDHQNIKIGAAWDEIERNIMGLDNTTPWSNNICGGGVVQATAAACTGGAGSSVPTGSIHNYLSASDFGFVVPNYAALFAVSNYAQYFNSAPINVNGAATGAANGGVNEATIGAYVEINGESEFMQNTLRYNAGARYIQTDQDITGVLKNASGGFGSFQTLSATYDAFLPSFNAVYELLDNVNVRMAASRTITRQNPNAMLPNTTFSDPSAQNATQGNPNLTPFFSNNFDLGGEWYTGGEGYVGVAFFRKTLTGFTQSGTNILPFSALGIPYASLTTTQQAAIDLRGGPNVATVTVTQQVNAGGQLDLNGYELNWVQPLDFLFHGLGFTANYTRINQSGSGAGAPVNAVNVPRYTYNVTGYYEDHGFSGRVSYTYADSSIQTSFNGPQDAFPYPANPTPGYRYTDARGQLDAALRYQIKGLPTEPTLTLDAINLLDEPRRETEGYPNAAYKYYQPGHSILLGVRGTF
ncbi:MAG TPA: TonB-dependent receptor [Caulobacterales bacterium]|nr:TonB-dependent receptor [Caulobacterales bacterium]